MSSFKNSMKTQKVHRERHQNEARAHLGPLEKKKDYKVRAVEQEKKKKLLKKLHKKALERNPDEYYQHMEKSQMIDGRHVENAPVRHKSIKDVKKDLHYVMSRRTMDSKQIDRLRASLHFLEPDKEEAPNSHILFVDTPEEAKEVTPAELLKTHPDMLARRFNRLTTEQLKTLPAKLSISKQDLKRASKDKSKAYKELCRRVERDVKLKLMQQKLEAKLQLMIHEKKNKTRHVKHPGPKIVHEGDDKTAPVYIWPQIRKK